MRAPVDLGLYGLQGIRDQFRHGLAAQPGGQTPFGHVGRGDFRRRDVEAGSGFGQGPVDDQAFEIARRKRGNGREHGPAARLEAGAGTEGQVETRVGQALQATGRRLDPGRVLQGRGHDGRLGFPGGHDDGDRIGLVGDRPQADGDDGLPAHGVDASQIRGGRGLALVVELVQPRGGVVAGAPDVEGDVAVRADPAQEKPDAAH